MTKRIEAFYARLNRFAEDHPAATPFLIPLIVPYAAWTVLRGVFKWGES
jgi:hypothetical protein